MTTMMTRERNDGESRCKFDDDDVIKIEADQSVLNALKMININNISL
jgi:hypothetical protein